MDPRTQLAVKLAGAVSSLSRRAGRGDGSVIGGRVMLAVAPEALPALARDRQIALVSGTNGKTTTTSLLRACLSTLGPVATNLMGANLPAGVATALGHSAPGTNAALEVDEAWLGRLVDATKPRVVALLNLSRDQLDRNNEVRTIANGWRQVFEGDAVPHVVANADDPLVAWAAGRAANAVWVAAGQPWTADAAGCPACGGRIIFHHSGWACDDCGFARPEVVARSEGDTLVFPDGRRAAISLQLPGRANRANALMAATTALCMGAEPQSVADAMSSTTEVVGRYRTVSVDDLEAKMLLSKNPAGWLEVLDVLRPGVPVVVAINARIADGRDPSWLWDVPFERLQGRQVVATGERGRDLAVRLRYAEVDHVFEPDLLTAVHSGAGMARSQGVGQFDVVGNYTSFQQLRALLP